MTHYQWQAEALLLHCHIQPGAKVTEVSGTHGDRLKIRLQAPPVDGKANEALVAFLAREFGVAKSAVTLVRGHSSRQKTVKIEQPQTLPPEFSLQGREGQ